MIKNLPPEDVAAAELFQKLLERPTPSEVIDFPRMLETGPIFRIRMRVLPQRDHDKAREEAHRKLIARGVKLDDMQAIGIREVYADQTAKEILALACVTEQAYGSEDRPVYGRLFKDSDAIASTLTADELAALFRAWQLVQSKYSPEPGAIDEEAWIKRLVEGGSAFPLSLISYQDAADLTFDISERHYALCNLLESQFSTLPEHLRSELSKFRIGTGYWSKLAEDSSTTDRTSKNTASVSLEDAVELDKRLERQEILRDVIETGNT